MLSYNRMQHIIKNIFLISIVFFFIYEVQPIGVPNLLTSRKLVFYILAILFILKNGLNLNFIPRRSYVYFSIKRLFVLSLCFMLWAFFLDAFLCPSGKQSIIQRSILLVPYTGFLYTFVYDVFDDEQQFFKALFWTTIIQSFIVFAHYFNDGVKMYLYTHFVLDANNTYLVTERAMGLGAGESLLSVNLFLGLIGTANFIIRGEKTLFYILGYVIILFACLLSGSTGFVSGVALLLFVVFYMTFVKKSNGIFGILVGLFVGMQIILMLASNFFTEIEDFEIFRKISEFWTVGAKESSIVTSLQAQAVAPITTETIIGTSLFRGNFNGIISTSDTGYYQNYFGYGLIGVIVFYSVLYFIMWSNIKRITDSNIKYLLLFLLLIIMFGEGKEPYIHHYGNIFVLFMASFLSQKTRIYEK